MIVEPVKKKALLFSNGNKALALFPLSENKISTIIPALGLDNYKAVIVISGGAGNMDQKLIVALSPLFEEGIAKAAAKVNAVIIDGGTKSGVMEMMGKGVAGNGYTSPLIGVVPLKKVSLPEEGESTKTALDPNHSHFVLVEGDDWGSETAILFDLARALAKNVPAIVILAGGGKVAKNEILSAERSNLHIIVLEGSGGLADELNTARKSKQFLPGDAWIAEIIEHGNLHFYSILSSVKEIEAQVTHALSDNYT